MQTVGEQITIRELCEGAAQHQSDTQCAECMHVLVDDDKAGAGDAADVNVSTGTTSQTCGAFYSCARSTLSCYAGWMVVVIDEHIWYACCLAVKGTDAG